MAIATVPMRMPLPPLPENGIVDPIVTTTEVWLLVIAAVLTVAVGVTLIVFISRQQRKGASNA
jgi:hypothetical protein